MPDYDVFLSYNWRDHEAVETVARELNARQLRVFLDRWYLNPGRSWRRELEGKLAQSAGALIFLGPGNLGNWQEREVDLALDRQAHSSDFAVIPILLPGADPALGFLSMNTWVDMRDGVRGPAITALDAAIRGHAAGTDSPSTATLLSSEIAPYRGLRPFREEDADLFYGREAFTTTLAEVVLRQPLVAVVGPSGSGKSSVVHAGLVPRLRRAGDGSVWEIATIVPGQRPLSALAGALVGLLEPALTERFVEAARLADALASGTVHLADVIGRVLQQQGGTERLLLVVDQWEELYALTTDEAARRNFIDTLLAATEGRSPLTVVLTMRGDFVGTALGYRPLSDRLQGAQVNLSTMTIEETERAMIEPARKVALEFEPGLVTRILDDVGDEPGTLPLLEFVLTELWRDRARGQLRHSTYEAIGGVRGAMAARADEVVGGLPAPDQEQVRRLLLHLVQPGTGTTDTRRRATLEEIGAESERFVRDLAGSRLLVTGQDETSGAETVEVAHEALIQHWGRLREWVDRDREFLMWRRRLESSIDDWEATGNDDGSLLRGAALAEAERWYAERVDDLGPAERGFIERSTALQQAQLSRARLVRRSLGATAAAVMAVVSVLAVVAVFQWQSAQSAQSKAEEALAETEAAQTRTQAALLETEAARSDAVESQRWAETAQAEAEAAQAEAEAALTVATSREFAARANGATGTSPQLALLLAAEAYRRAPTVESLDAISKAQAGWGASPLISFGDPLIGHNAEVRSVAFSPNGSIVASAGQDGTVRLWDADERRPIGRPLTGHEGPVLGVAFSPGGAILASAGADGTVRLWDVAGSEFLHSIVIGEPVLAVTFSVESLAIAAGETVRLWSVADGHVLPGQLDHFGRVYSVAFSPDGATLATGRTERYVWGWELASREPHAHHPGEHARVYGVAFSSDGSTLASAGLEGTIRLWDVATEAPIGGPLTGPTGALRSVAFSPDGVTVAGASSDQKVWLWDIAAEVPPGSPRHGRGLGGHLGPVLSVTFSPKGSTLGSAGVDGTVRLWNPAARQASSQPLVGSAGSTWVGDVLNVAFSPNGAIVAAAGSRDLHLWDAATLEAIDHPLVGGSESAKSLAFSPDSRILAFAGDEGTVHLWDIVAGRAFGEPFADHAGGVLALAFSPDGEMLASAGSDGTVRLWDMIAGRLHAEPLAGHDGKVWRVAFSPNEAILASAGDDGTVRLWDIADGRPHGEPLAGHDGIVRSVAFSQDGSVLASAGHDRTIRLWDVATRNLNVQMVGHGAPVYGVAFSPDGEILASVGEDATVRLWHVATGRPIGEPLTGHRNATYDVAFSPDGKTIASGGDLHLRLWDSPTLGAACSLANLGPLPSLPRFLEENGGHWACENSSNN